LTTSRERWASLLWPLILLAIFVGTFRRANSSQNAGVVTEGCDTVPAQPAAAAVADYERCLALDPADAELLTALGRAYASQGHLEQAEATYRRALMIDPHNSDLHVLLGELLLTRGDRAGARREANEALRWRPNGLAATRLAGLASHENGGPDQ
jgi:cytochrome c-type biogenesis protein CcmH/NrfG